MKIGDRIKTFYEDRTKTFLPRRMITIIRLDGKSFSKWTKNLEKPFDDGFSDDMDATAVYLCENIQGAKFAYTQSDEITVVLTDFDSLDSQAWFDYNVQKMTSISASLATAKFNQLRMFREGYDSEYKLACFDARVFQVPDIEEMINTIIWRQQDCTRNSVSMAAHALLGHSATMNKSSDEKQELLFKEKGVNWNDYKVKYKRGVVIKKQTIWVDGQNGEPVQRSKWLPDYNIPIFTQEKEYLYNLIPVIKITEDNIV
jgi:tRNA(His) 5'-end guanylyltransferase